ncbi:UNVERIFIED_ORG: hypothetical protein CLV66_103389 [Actinomadura viridilutea]
MCGADAGFHLGVLSGPGPSPRVRGRRDADVQAVAGGGTIPACAGPTVDHCAWSLYQLDHPRVCGADQAGNRKGPAGLGPSPRVRGRPGGRAGAAGLPGTIPACAGPTLTDLGVYDGNNRFSFSWIRQLWLHLVSLPTASGQRHDGAVRAMGGRVTPRGSCTPARTGRWAR